jgi:hypothetical protein
MEWGTGTVEHPRKACRYDRTNVLTCQEGVDTRGGAIPAPTPLTFAVAPESQGRRLAAVMGWEGSDLRNSQRKDPQPCGCGSLYPVLAALLAAFEASWMRCR